MLVVSSAECYEIDYRRCLRRRGSIWLDGWLMVAGVQPLMDGKTDAIQPCLRVVVEAESEQRDEDLAKPNVKRRLCLVLIAMASRWGLEGVVLYFSRDGRQPVIEIELWWVEVGVDIRVIVRCVVA